MALSKENYLKSFIKFNSLTGNKENTFKYCKNNTDTHEDRKYLIYKQLVKKGYTVFTEVEFKDNLGRADLVCIDLEGNGWIFEIVHSESEESMSEKINKYPIDFNIEFVHTSKSYELPI